MSKTTASIVRQRNFRLALEALRAHGPTDTVGVAWHMSQDSGDYVAPRSAARILIALEKRDHVSRVVEWVKAKQTDRIRSVRENQWRITSEGSDWIRDLKAAEALSEVV
jgi:hypothetical protein